MFNKTPATFSRPRPVRVWRLALRCRCGWRFSVLSWAIRTRTLAICPSCGHTRFILRARFLSPGRPFPWAPGALPLALAPVLPPYQLVLL